MIKFRFLNIAVILFILFGASMITSCAGSVEEPVEPEENTMSLGIQFRIPTRASESGGLLSDEDDYESYVDIENDNYRIYFFDSDNKFIARFNTKITQRIKGDGYVAYNVYGVLPESVASYSNFKMVMIANWEQGTAKYDDNFFTVGETTIEDLCTADWAQYKWIGNKALNPDADAAKRVLMPFYGVQEYKGVVFQADELTRLEEPLYLLRAMAKVEVMLETAKSDNLTFSSIKICGYNEKGYCAPKDVFSYDDYNQALDRQKQWTLHLIGDSNDSQLKSYDFRKDGSSFENDRRIETRKMYLPEYENIDVGDNYSRIEAKLNFQLDDDAPFTIHFAEYADGKADNSKRFNIERNNLYRFRVICDGYNYKLSLIVSDWAGLYENNFEFGSGQIVSPVKPWDDQINNDIEFK